MDAALVRTLDELQASVLQCAILECKPEAHRRVGLCVQEPRVLMRCHLAANAGVLEDVHALANCWTIELQLPTNLTHPIAKCNFLECGMFHMQCMTHFVQRNHGIHNQLTLLVECALFEKVAHLVARLHEVQLLALCIFRLQRTERLATRLWCIQAECASGLVECLYFFGCQKVLDDQVAIVVELKVKITLYIDDINVLDMVIDIIYCVGIVKTIDIDNLLIGQ